MQKVPRTRGTGKAWRVKECKWHRYHQSNTFHLWTNLVKVQALKWTENILRTEVSNSDPTDKRAYELICISRRQNTRTRQPYRATASINISTWKQDANSQRSPLEWKWRDACRKISCWERTRIFAAWTKHKRTSAFGRSFKVKEEDGGAATSQRWTQFINLTSPCHFWRGLRGVDKNDSTVKRQPGSERQWSQRAQRVGKLEDKRSERGPRKTGEAERRSPSEWPRASRGLKQICGPWGAIDLDRAASDKC